MIMDDECKYDHHSCIVCAQCMACSAAAVLCGCSQLCCVTCMHKVVFSLCNTWWVSGQFHPFGAKGPSQKTGPKPQGQG